MLTTHLKTAARLMEEGDFSGACDEFFSAIALSPPSGILAEIYFQLGTSLINLKDYNAAEGYLLKSEAILLNMLKLEIEDTAHIRQALIFLYDNTRQTDKLKDYCMNILATDRANAEAATALTNLYFDEKNYNEAVKVIIPALEEHADNKNVLYSGLIAEAKTGMLESALQHAKEYLRRFGNDQQLTMVIGDIYHDLGMAREMVAAYEEVYKQRDGKGKYDLSEFMLANSLYDEIYDKKKLQEILNYRLEYTNHLIKKTRFDNEPRFFKRLKVGYLSNEFRRHPVGYFLIPVFGTVSAEYGEYICYSYVDPDSKDGVTDYLFKNASAVIEVYDASNEEIEKQILDDKPDIMMELKSFTKGNKLGLYAGRLAPVQISWIGFPCSTGVSAIDYIITDKCVDPYPEAQELYSEKLLYLKDTFLCCKLPVPESIGKSAFLKNGYITFGCFNNYVKITDRMLKNWSVILNAVNGSKIMFMALVYNIDYAVQLFKERLVKFGFNLENVIIKNAVALDKYYFCYDDVDIILDTYPFNGATTTFDSLLMGVPLVTMVGKNHHSRVGLDLLSHVELGDLACYSDNEYINKAIELANNHKRIIDLKENLRNTTLKSKLCDANGFRDEYEHALRKAWIGYCANHRNNAEEHRSLNELCVELENGCRYIIKCALDGELCGATRDMLFDEFLGIFNAYSLEIIKTETCITDTQLFDLIHRALNKLKEMNDEHVIKVLQLILKHLSSQKY